MTTTTEEPPRAQFRLSQLIYDTRYRSMTIQTVAFILLLAAITWLVSNTVANLEALGKDFDFGFLDQRAGYDINQTLIPYTSGSTHARAALVGILNTLLVAVLGCTLATIIGVFAGVLRLSSNWLVARLMTVYVEGFRNVPLLLWIIAIFAVMTESTPQPRDFREDGTASMAIFDSVAISNRGVYIPNLVFSNSLGGNPVTKTEAAAASSSAASSDGGGGVVGTYGGSRIATGGSGGGNDGGAGIATGQSNGAASGGGAEQAASGGGGDAAASVGGEIIPVANGADWALILGVLAVSIIAIVMIRRWALRRKESTGRLPRTWYYQLGLLVIPTGLVLWFLGAQWDYPVLGGFNFDGGVHLRNSLIALWLALSLYTGAFIAEIVRSGILSVSKGQSEAAFALGLRPRRVMNLVILPQALRVIIPPLISQYLNLTKNSSLAIAVGYMDVRSTLGGITINQTGRELEGMLLMALFYLLLSFAISGVLNIYNASIKLKER